MRQAMTDFDSWPWGLKLLMLMGPFLLSMTGCGISAFVAYTRRFEVAYKCLEGHPGLVQMKRFYGAKTQATRWLLLTFICGVLIYPDVHLRRGHLSEDALRQFPVALKRILKFSAWLTIVGLVWMVVTYVCVTV